MTLLQTTRAQEQAQHNRSLNLAAIAQTQSDLHSALAEDALDLNWMFGRDGSLTALLDDGQWWAGCSLPTQAARAMLLKLEVKGAVACFLNPAHAAHVRVALDTVRLEQAVIVIVPQVSDLTMMLYCEDFSEAITSHRLWFVSGPNWEGELDRLFDQQPGLATPAQFIRTPDSDSQQIETLMPVAQRVFSHVSSRRANEIQSLREQMGPISRSKPRLCVVAPSRFRLWNDIGQALLSALDGAADLDVVHFDADDPTRSAPLALLKSARDCTAILTANTARSDLPGLLPESVPWITWATTARIPSSALAGCNDHLIVIDPALREMALKAGWAESHIHIGGWKKAQRPRAQLPIAKQVALICDTSSLEVPADLIEYSSHALLWESIRHDLLHNPLGLGGVGRFLAERMGRLNIGAESFPQNRFVEKLILPAYQQGIARMIIAAKMPLRLYGDGWEAIDEFHVHAAGTVRSREEFDQAVSASAVLLHAWPSSLAHPIDAMHIPVVRCAGKDQQTLLRNIRGILDGATPAPPAPIPGFDAALIHSIAAGIETGL